MQKPNLNPPIKSVCTSSTGASATTPVFIIETYKNGTEWYRKYSDGVIEQGGFIDNLERNSDVTNNFVTAFTDPNTVSLHLTTIVTGSYSNYRGGNAASTITTTTFTVNVDAYVENTNGAYWEARGI